MTYNFFNLNSMMSGFPLLGAQIFGNNFGNFNMGNFNIGNQNADLGYNIGSILCNTGCLVVNSYRTEKAAEKQADLDMDTELRNIDKEIKEVEDSNPKDKISKSYEDNIKKAEGEKEATITSLAKATENYNKLNDAYEKDKSNATLKSNVDEAKKIMDKLNEKLDTLNGEAEMKGSIKYYEAQKEAELERLQEEKEHRLTELKEKKAKLENQINNRDLDKLSKKVKKGSDDVLTDKLNKDGTLNKDKSFDVTDFNTAVHRLMNSTRGSEERYKNAKLVSNIYKRLPETDKNSRLKKCAEIAEEEIRKHKKPDNETQTA